MREPIGTVEITRTRVYRLDPGATKLPGLVFTEVIVEPGTYPVFEDGITRYWQMFGVLDHRSYRLGDGAFAASPSGSDVRSEDNVVFYSQRYGPDEWKDLVSTFETDTNPALIFHVTEKVTT